MLASLARFVAVATVVLAITSDPAYAAEIEDYASYDPQTRCASRTQPGTAYLLDWLVRKHPGTGKASTLRSCSGGGTSEHKDGRALDWSVDADRAEQRAQAEAFLGSIFATDARGNTHARARRMGIMYVIWDDHMYASYRRFEQRDYLSSSCSSVRTCSKTLRHRDHVHISLSRAGAAASTSFYTRRGVPTSR